MLVKKKSILLLVVTIFILSSGIVYAQCPGEGDGKKPPMLCEKGPGHGPGIPDLSDEQKEQIETLHLELMEAVKPLENEIGEKEARLRTLQTEEKVNMAQINKLIEDIGDLRTDIMKLKVACHQEVRSLLTDKQRVFFDAHKPPHDVPGGHGGPPGHGPR